MKEFQCWRCLKIAKSKELHKIQNHFVEEKTTYFLCNDCYEEFIKWLDAIKLK
jgi:hypothetical protein